MMEKKLPKNWQIKKLNDVSKKLSLNKLKIKQKEYLPSGLFPVIDQGQDLIGGYYNDESLLVSDEPPYIIFGDHTKVKKYISFKFIPGADGVKVLKAKENILPKFLFYLLFTIKIEDKGYARHFQLLEKESFLIPNDIETQQAIVSKIEELFSELDKGIEDLKTAQQQLKTYRQSVLKWAFEGKLTNENVKDGELPKGWETLKIKDVSKVINGDRSKNYPSRSHYVNEGIPFISAGTIDENKINKTDINYITESKFDSLRSGKLEKRDLIYCLRGSLGKCAIYPFGKGAISSSLCIVRASELIELEYLFYYLLSPLANNEILKYDNGTAQPNLSAKDFSNFEIPFASKDEQHQIVQEIESRLSVADKMEESIAQSLQQAEALRQSILKKAFSGELV